MAFSTSKEILFVSIYRGECLFMKKNCQTNHFCFCPLLEFFYSFFFLYFFVLVCFFSSFLSCWIFREFTKSSFTAKGDFTI